MIKLSVTSKLDGIRSWSLQAIDTCPGAVQSAGVLVDACKGCYAVNGNYRFPNVKAPREHNKTDWKRPEWISDMVNELKKDRYFRWFDSGDVYSVKLAQKMLEIMTLTTWVQHWLPTRMHKFTKFKTVLDDMQALPNVMVRFSSDSVTGEYETGLHGSVIVPTPADTTKEMKLCEAYSHGGKCNGCRACYDKTVDVIAYPAHGVSMMKVIRIIKQGATA
jgi:hypothetical protein